MDDIIRGRGYACGYGYGRVIDGRGSARGYVSWSGVLWGNGGADGFKYEHEYRSGAVHGAGRCSY